MVRKESPNGDVKDIKEETWSSALVTRIIRVHMLVEFVWPSQAYIPHPDKAGLGRAYFTGLKSR